RGAGTRLQRRRLRSSCVGSKVDGTVFVHLGRRIPLDRMEIRPRPPGPSCLAATTTAFAHRAVGTRRSRADSISLPSEDVYLAGDRRVEVRLSLTSTRIRCRPTTWRAATPPTSARRQRNERSPVALRSLEPRSHHDRLQYRVGHAGGD